MPIGLALCFGPAVLVWWLTHKDEPTSGEKNDRH